MQMVGQHDAGGGWVALGLVGGEGLGRGALGVDLAGQDAGVDDRLRGAVGADRYIGWAASPSSVVRPWVQTGSGSRSTMGNS